MSSKQHPHQDAEGNDAASPHESPSPTREEAPTEPTPMAPGQLSADALRHFSEEGITKYLLGVDQPDWPALRDNPGFCDQWVVTFLKRPRPISQVELKRVYTDEDFRKVYAIRLWLLRNKQVPISIGLNIMSSIKRYDLFTSLKIPHTPIQIKKRIEGKLKTEFPRLPTGEKIALARQAPRGLIRFLRTSDERPVLRAVLNNYFFTYEDAMFIANNPRTKPTALEELARARRWTAYKDVRRSLLRNPRTPTSCLKTLLRQLTSYDLEQLLRDPQLSGYARQLIRRTLTKAGNRSPS